MIWPFRRRQPPAVPGEFWQHLPPGAPGGLQRLLVCRPEDGDFARLDWLVCEQCRLGVIGKISVDAEYRRRGYASRMIRWALQKHEGYAWATSPQSRQYGRPFFRALSRSVKVPLPATGGRCPHMETVVGNQPGLARRESPPS